MVPNLLSASRIVGALALLAVYRPDSSTRSALAVVLVLLMLLTDVLDGMLARRLGVASEFGYLLDGLGDRSVHVAAYLLLVMAGVISIFLAWMLIFREICQYGVRLVEAGWHGAQSQKDRIVTRLYTITVHGVLLGELGRTAAGWEASSAYSLAVTMILIVIAAAAYSRLLPRLRRAWRDAAGP